MKKALSLIIAIGVIIIGLYMFFSGISGILGDNKGTNKEIIAMTTEEKSKYLKENCNTYTYEEIARQPEEHKNELVVFTGEVTQVQKSSNKTILLVNVTKKGDEYFSYYTDNVYVKYEFADGLKVLEGDVINMYGEFLGEKNYTSVLGEKITVPYIMVYYAELNNG